MAGKIKAGICLACLICALALLLTSCDFRLMSKQEVEEYLEKQYGQEFTVLSSESATDDYYDDVWRVRVYTVSPKDNPYGVTVNLTYREPAWPEDQSCLIKIDSFYLSGFDTNTETFEKYNYEVVQYEKMHNRMVF